MSYQNFCGEGSQGEEYHDVNSNLDTPSAQFGAPSQQPNYSLPSSSGMYQNGYTPQQQSYIQRKFPDALSASNQANIGSSTMLAPSYGTVNSYVMAQDGPWTPIAPSRQSTLSDSQPWNEHLMFDALPSLDQSAWMPPPDNSGDDINSCRVPPHPAYFNRSTTHMDETGQWNPGMLIPAVGYPPNLEVSQDQTQTTAALEHSDVPTSTALQQQPLLCMTCKVVCKSKAVLK